MNIDFDEYPITEEEVISILGNDYKIMGNELVWGCPSCRAMGGDNAGDNLKFNRDKHVLKCFACDFGTEVVGIIARRRYDKNKDYEFTPKPKSMPQNEQTKEPEIPRENLDVYYWNCLVDLMKNKDVMRNMYEKHTILPTTALACGIGYDKTKDMLVFPSKSVASTPTDCDCPSLKANGAEYREYQGEKKIRRISGYDSRICCVIGSQFTMQGYICEGYKDAYNLYQILKITQPDVLKYSAIFTVQNGTNSINANNCLQKVNWNILDNVYLLMDNDKAGDKATEVALGFFPKMIDYRKEFLNEYSDIQEKFKAEYGNKINIEKALSAEWLDEWKNEGHIQC